MNDITALAQRMKAAAEKAIEANERLCVMPPDEIFDVSLVHSKQLDADITVLNAHYDESTPTNVLALVEALEKAQAGERRWHRVASRVHEQACDSDVKIDELEKEVAGLNSARQRVAELEESHAQVIQTCDYYKRMVEEGLKRIHESRTVTVKLPKRSVGEVMHMSGFSRDYAEGWCSGNDNAINEMKLAGIQVIEGEE